MNRVRASLSENRKAEKSKWGNEMKTTIKVTSVLTPADHRWVAFATALDAAATKHGCRHDHQLAEQIMRDMGGIDIPGSIAFFERQGGYCDCEILFNVDPSVRGDYQ